MMPFQQMKCLVGLHRRSRGAAWSDGRTYRSVCRGCGQPMRKVDGRWILDPPA